MVVTENDLADLARTIRAEVAEQLLAERQELRVRLQEGLSGVLSLDDVRREVAEISLSEDAVRDVVRHELAATPIPTLTIADVRREAANVLTGVQELLDSIENTPVPTTDRDVEELKGKCLRMKVFVNEIADRIGAPRMGA